jgi:hypothetical protein
MSLLPLTGCTLLLPLNVVVDALIGYVVIAPDWVYVVERVLHT